MQGLKEEPREIYVVAGTFPNSTIYVMVGHDVTSGSSLNSFPPREGSIPHLVGAPPKQEPGFLHTCEIEWETADGKKHRGTIQVKQVLISLHGEITPYRESE